jgi:hypothetical protein
MIVATDAGLMGRTVQAFIPLLRWPLDDETIPERFAGLDLVEFCFQRAERAHQRGYHQFFGHWHLEFEADGARDAFRNEINLVLSRNGVGLELGEDGRVARTLPVVVATPLLGSIFRSGDLDLDRLLEDARRKFRDRDPEVRRESLEKLWDAFERLKTIEIPGDKQASVTQLLSRAIPEPNLRSRLDSELRELTAIGNSFMIRHAEVGKTAVAPGESVDYLFHRLFSAIRFLLRGTGRGG